MITPLFNSIVVFLADLCPFFINSSFYRLFQRPLASGFQSLKVYSLMILSDYFIELLFTFF